MRILVNTNVKVAFATHNTIRCPLKTTEIIDEYESTRMYNPQAYIARKHALDKEEVPFTFS
jgi:hypothetical protein